MKKFLTTFAVFVSPVFAVAGDCHGTKAPATTSVLVEEKVTVVAPPAFTAQVTASVVAPPQSLALVFRNANREARATKRAAVQAHRAARFAAKASDAAGQEARQEEVMRAYQAR